MNLHDSIKAEVTTGYNCAFNPERTTNNIELCLMDAAREQFEKIAKREKWPTTLNERNAAVRDMMQGMFGKAQQHVSDST